MFISAGRVIAGAGGARNLPPLGADVTTSTVTALPTIIVNDGVSTSTITVQLKNNLGNNLTTSDGVVVISTSGSPSVGSMGGTTDNSDGTYTATLTSSTLEEIATITATLDATPITDNATVQFANEVQGNLFEDPVVTGGWLLRDYNEV